jgi:hypothetical protein
MVMAAAIFAFMTAHPDALLAHERIAVGDGQYEMVVGFGNEPAYVGEPNALSLRVEAFATGGAAPVDDLAGTLSAEVSKDGQTFSRPLEPLGEGAYEMAFVPTAAGDYTFRIFGEIGEVPVDESVTSGPETFSSVEPLSAIEFPIARSDPAQLQQTAQQAQADAGTARMVGLAGIALGAVGLVVAAVALARMGRASSTTVAPAAAAAASPPSGKLIR